jgi:hypothetical protein
MTPDEDLIATQVDTESDSRVPVVSVARSVIACRFLMAAPSLNSATVKFTLTSSDVFRALVADLVRRRWFALALPILGAVGVIWAIADPADPDASLPSGLVCIAIGGVLFGLLPYLQTRALMKSPSIGSAMSLTASDQGIEFVGSHSNGRVDWAVVKAISESSNRILIYLLPVGFHIVPKGQIASSDLNAFRAVLRAHVTRYRGSRSAPA